MRWSSPPGLGEQVPPGCLPSLPPAHPAFALPFLPPSPRPPSRREGGDQSYFMQGASPLASPGLGGTRHWERGRTTRPAGGVPLTGRGEGASRYPAGGVPGWLPAKPPFSLLFCPLSPQPPSRREGGDFRLFYARGFAPCIPRAEPIRRGFDLEETVSFGYAKDLSLQ